MHVLADALTSILAIAALLAGRYLGWVWMDPMMGIVGAVVIARWSWTLLHDTAAVLLDRTDPHVAAEIRALVEDPGDPRHPGLPVRPEAHRVGHACGRPCSLRGYPTPENKKESKLI